MQIPIDETFVSDLAADALQDAGTTADQIAALFAQGRWTHYGPSAVECQRAIQYRQELEAAFVLQGAGEILIATWQDGFLTLELQGEDDED